MFDPELGDKFSYIKVHHRRILSYLYFLNYLFMKALFLFLFTMVIILGSQAQVTVRTVIPVHVDSVAYPNLAGNTTSSQPHPGTVILADGSEVKGKITLFKKRGQFSKVKIKAGDQKLEFEAAQISSIKLDDKVYVKKYPNNYKNPEKNFQPGYIVLPTGDRLEGKVAQLRDFSDYDFFIYTVLFLPEGGEVASSFKGGLLTEFGQQVNGTLRIWDGYADGYLLRIVDGRYRLCRNPYSRTKNEFFTSLKNQATDSLSKEAARAALVSGIKNGGNLNESIENAANAGTAVSEVFGQVEINRKEYLIFDSYSKSVATVNKDTFKEYAANLGNKCSVSVFSWDKIEEFIRSVNSSCP